MTSRKAEKADTRTGDGRQTLAPAPKPDLTELFSAPRALLADLSFDVAGNESRPSAEEICARLKNIDAQIEVAIVRAHGGYGA